MNRTGWSWRFAGPEDEVLERPVSPAFTTRFDAEAWIGESWRTLAAEGVASATLLLRDDVVAPPLPLRAP